MGSWQNGHPMTVVQRELKKGIHRSKIYEIVEKMNQALL